MNYKQYRLLEKVAAGRPDKENNIGRNAAIAGASVIGGNRLYLGTARHIGTKQLNEMRKLKDEVKKTKDFASKMQKMHNLKVDIHIKDSPAKLLSRMGPIYVPNFNKGGKGTVYFPFGVRSEYMAHELGHAVDFRRFPKIKSKLRMRGPLVGLAAAAGLMLDDDKREYAPGAAFAGFAPMLYQEGKASVIGVNALRRIYGNKAAIKGGKNLLKAFGGYLAGPALVATGFGAVNSLVSAIDKSKRKKTQVTAE